jgi:hypothetical protein
MENHMRSEEFEVYKTIFYEKGTVEGKECNVAKIHANDIFGENPNSYTEGVNKLKEILATSSEPESDIEVLLSVRNWRPHFIACIAAFYVADRERMVSLLWKALDKGSWASPQLAASLSILDSCFIENAVARLKTGALIMEPLPTLVDRFKIDSIENPKGFLALWSLVNKINNQLLSDCNISDIKRRLDKEADNISNISLHWREKMLGMLNA